MRDYGLFRLLVLQIDIVEHHSVAGQRIVSSWIASKKIERGCDMMSLFQHSTRCGHGVACECETKSAVLV